MKTETGKDRVMQVLLRGGKWPTPILAENSGCADNTTIKWLNIYCKDKAIEYGYRLQKEQVPGKSYNQYWLEKIDSKYVELLKAIDHAIETYPDGLEKEKVELQKEQILLRNMIAA